MNLFLDEKTKEQVALEYERGLPVNEYEAGLYYAFQVRGAYLAGWNECEKHVRESFGESFEKEVRARTHKAMDGLGIELQRANECIIMQMRKIDELEKEIESLRQAKSYMSDVIDQKSAQIKERDDALIDLVCAMETTWPGENGVMVELFHATFLAKHQSLINQIKEGGK